jgi:hypothetical protein
MAESSRAKIEDAILRFKPGLKPFVERELQAP